VTKLERDFTFSLSKFPSLIFVFYSEIEGDYPNIKPIFFWYNIKPYF